MELLGRSILLVEDEPLIALDVASALTDEGAQVGIATSLASALTLLGETIWSAALVDHMLGTHNSEKLWAELEKLGIPFAVHSGYSREGHAAGVPFLTKPCPNSEIVMTLARLIDPIPAIAASAPHGSSVALF